MFWSQLSLNHRKISEHTDAPCICHFITVYRLEDIMWSNVFIMSNVLLMHDKLCSWKILSSCRYKSRLLTRYVYSRKRGSDSLFVLRCARVNMLIANRCVKYQDPGSRKHLLSCTHVISEVIMVAPGLGTARSYLGPHKNRMIFM